MTLRHHQADRKEQLVRQVTERCLGPAYQENSGRYADLAHSLGKLSQGVLIELILGLNEHRCQKCFSAPKSAGVYCDSCFNKSICRSCGVRQKREDLGVCQTCAES